MTTGLVEEYEVLDRNIADGKVITHTHTETYVFGRTCVGTQGNQEPYKRKKIKRNEKAHTTPDPIRLQ